MQTNINNIVSGSSSNQLFLYAGHDNHIYSMLMLLNLDVNLTQPLYVSSIALELSQSVSNSANYYVQVYFKNNDANQPISPQLMNIKGFSKFLKFL